MGALLAKFRKEKSTTELLEGLEDKIQQLEKYTLNTQEQKKRFVGNFLAISIGVYVLAFIVFYFMHFPKTWIDRIIYFAPLLIFPLVIILLRKLFTWYFQRKLNKNFNVLTALRAEKKKILEQVMDKETYKVAVNLLQRFGDKSAISKPSFALTPRTAGAKSQAQPTRPLVLGNSEINILGNMRPLNSSYPGTPSKASPLNQAVTPIQRQLSLTPQQGSGQMLRRRTPFPIINQQAKGVFERIVDLVIGDGPQDRFAMICKECYGHNGMALKEEFDYITFRCAFCNLLNPARKSRPIAPRLPVQQSTPQRITAGDSSDSSSSDVDSDHDPRVPRGHLTESKIITTTETAFESADQPESNAADELMENYDGLAEEGEGKIMKEEEEEKKPEKAAVKPTLDEAFKKEM